MDYRMDDDEYVTSNDSGYEEENNGSHAIFYISDSEQHLEEDNEDFYHTDNEYDLDGQSEDDPEPSDSNRSIEVGLNEAENFDEGQIKDETQSSALEKTELEKLLIFIECHVRAVTEHLRGKQDETEDQDLEEIQEKFSNLL